jgi:hypothetical protein
MTSEFAELALTDPVVRSLQEQLESGLSDADAIESLIAGVVTLAVQAQDLREQLLRAESITPRRFTVRGRTSAGMHYTNEYLRRLRS